MAAAGKLTEALGNDITLHEWQGGLLLQAGEYPELGDMEAGVVPEPYVAVNAALRPIRYEAYPNTPMALIKVPEPLDSYEETLRRVRRFDRED